MLTPLAVRRFSLRRNLGASIGDFLTILCLLCHTLAARSIARAESPDKCLLCWCGSNSLPGTLDLLREDLSGQRLDLC